MMCSLKKPCCCINDNHLKEEEREFLSLIYKRDFEKLLYLLEKHGQSINVNCCDFRGYRALDITTSLRDEELLRELLALCTFEKDHLQRAILKAIDVDDIKLVKLLIDRCQHEKKDEFVGLTPIMQAAIKGNFAMVRFLIHKGYTIVKPHLPRCDCLQCQSSEYNSFETLQDSVARINAYRALTSPIYIILTSSDPILTAFELSHETHSLANEFCENKEIYDRLSEECDQFAADFLHQCRTTEEAEILLTQKKGFNEFRNHRYSRLCLAVQYKQKRFISHTTCQEVLHSAWVEGLNEWRTLSTRKKLQHIIKQTLLFPFVSIVYVLSPRTKVTKPLRVPMNRFIYSVVSYCVFLKFLLFILLMDSSDDIQNSEIWCRFGADIWILGNMLDVIFKIWSMGFSSYTRFWWNNYDLIMHISFMVSESIILGIYLHCYFVKSNVASNRMELQGYHPILIAEGIFACSSIMAFCRVMMWYQMQSRLGPLGTSLTYMVNDVIRFFLIFFILMFSFATGINSLYKKYRGSTSVDKDGNIIEQPREFVRLSSTFKALFWACFGMGEPEYADIVVNGIFSNFSRIEHSFTENVGYGIWGLYHLLIVIVLLNMLVAMMAESYERIQGNADMEWKFARCTLWLSYFDNEIIVPPPFNLLPSLRRLVKLARWTMRKSRDSMPPTLPTPEENSVSCKCCNSEETESVDVRRYGDEYEKLLFQLRRRYLDWKYQREAALAPSTLSDSCYELSEKFKHQQVLEDEKKYSTDKMELRK